MMRDLLNTTTKLCLVVLLAGVFATACSKSESPPEVKQKPVAIERVAGMKYYVGGPVMKQDDYGRTHVAGFNGEVNNPTSRGLLIGLKTEADKTFEFRTWLDGRPMARSSGYVDGEGLFWPTMRVSLDRKGRPVVRQRIEYDDEAKVMRSTFEHLDPETGKVVESKKQDLPYSPPSEQAEQDKKAG